MSRRLPLLSLLVLGALAVGSTASRADVLVLENRTEVEVRFGISPPEGVTERFELASHDVRPVPVTGNVEISFEVGGVAQRYLLEPGAIYFFETASDEVDLFRLLVTEDPSLGEVPARGVSPAASRPGASLPGKTLPGQGPIGVVPVMLLVDEDEPAVQRVWEKRLRDRLATASAIIQRHCRVRFEAVAAGTWNSDDAIDDFDQSLAEFERAVRPAPAAIAIGFTSQYALLSGRYHAGGTRGPMHSHVLIRERAPQFSQTERLQVLVHELGHVLGAAHSADPNSVMRPELSHRRARARDFRIHFDPINTLAMYLVGEELRRGEMAAAAATDGAFHHPFQQFRPRTKQRLRAVYATMARLLPDDPAAAEYLTLLGPAALSETGAGETNAERPATPVEPSGDVRRAAPPEQVRNVRIEPLAEAARVVVEAIRIAADKNHQMGGISTGSDDRAGRMAGDQLTELLFRRGAQAAADLPENLAVDAYLLGLGIGLDDSDVLRTNPITGGLCVQSESPQQRRRRLAVLGRPTMRGRRDLAQHFVVSCALTVVVGPETAQTIGTAKEVRDSHGGSGFSLVDLSANLAGITFATHLSESKLSLAAVSSSFKVENFLPPSDGLTEGMLWDNILGGIGPAWDARFGSRRDEIRRRILALPGYRNQRVR